MTIRRRAAVIGAVAVGLATLAACEKPTPLAYVTVGTTSEHTEAEDGCYKDGDEISSSQVQKCLDAEPTETITVEPGDRLRLGVDKSIGEDGWYLALNGEAVTDPTEHTYRSVPTDGFFQVDPATGERRKSLKLSFVSGSMAEDRYYGVWNFTVKLDD
ncbi:DUF2771 domain-containing protein [Streptomyces capparidis]